MMAAGVARRTLIREIQRLPAPQVKEVLAFVRSLIAAPDEANSRPEPVTAGVRAVLAWAARAEAATADRLVLEEPIGEADVIEAPETPFALPRLVRVPDVR